MTIFLSDKNTRSNFCEFFNNLCAMQYTGEYKQGWR